jgi:hypothetical protein
MVRYRVMLTETEVAELYAIISKGAHSTHTFRNAYILLNCDEGAYGQKVGNEQLAKMLRVNSRTIQRAKKRFCEEGWRRYFSVKHRAAPTSARRMVKWKRIWCNCAAVNRPKAVQDGH